MRDIPKVVKNCEAVASCERVGSAYGKAWKIELKPGYAFFNDDNTNLGLSATTVNAKHAVRQIKATPTGC